MNHKILEQTNTNAILAETLVPIGRRNFLTGRFEWSQRDELLHDERAYNIGAYTAGYTRDIGLFRNLQTGIGANFTAYTLPGSLKAIYGSHPVGVSIFLRVRLRSGA
jgi:hypothetical protein